MIDKTDFAINIILSFLLGFLLCEGLTLSNKLNNAVIICATKGGK